MSKSQPFNLILLPITLQKQPRKEKFTSPMYLFKILLTTLALLAVLLCNIAECAAHCKASERKSLLLFKAGVGDSEGRLRSWAEETDCCRWLGITCNTTAGGVTGIDFSGHRLPLNGTANMAALSNLSNLQRLDLSLNDFDSAILVPQIERLTNLAYLDLSNAGFSGKIPAEIGNLTRLKTLHLANIYRPSDAEFYVRSYFEIENLNWLSRLGQLRSLLLDGVDLSGVGKDWGPAVSSLGQLARLSMAECALFPLFPDESSSLRNLSASLRHLDLSVNGNRDFPTQIPAWLQNFTALQTLDLSGCALSGNVFPIQNLPLRTLDLFSNNLSGNVSFIFWNQWLLSWLSLKQNKFGGTIPVNISLPSLTHLDLSENNFGGSELENIATLLNLQHLNLGYNDFRGEIPISFFQMSSLNFLDLGPNRFSGEIPSNLGDLTKLKYLDHSQISSMAAFRPVFRPFLGWSI